MSSLGTPATCSACRAARAGCVALHRASGASAAARRSSWRFSTGSIPREGGAFFGHYLDEGGASRSSYVERLPCCRSEILDVLDSLRPRAESGRYHAVVATEIDRVILLDRAFHAEPFARHDAVVKNDRDDADAIAHCSLDVHSVHADRTG